jgi:hypothetical protein
VLSYEAVGFFLQPRPGSARKDPSDPTAMREVAIRGVDDRVNGLLEQVALNGLEKAARGGRNFGEDRVYFFFLLRGTLAPARRASDRPIAIACLRLFTFLPERPLFSVPRLRSCIARFTFFCAFLPYLAMGTPAI